MSTTNTYRHDYEVGEQIGKTADGQPVVASSGDGSVDEAFIDATRPKHRYDEPEISGRTSQGWKRRPSETTFNANRKDAHGNPLPTTAMDGRDLKAQRKRMWMWQHGYYGDGGKKSAIKDKLSLTEALGDTLNLSDAIVRDAKRLVMKVDARAFNRLGNIKGNIDDDDNEEPNSAPIALALGCLAVAQNRMIETPEEYEVRIQVREFERHDGDKPLFKEIADRHDVDWYASMKQVKEQVN
ncbi:hypothetical protein [Halopelagius longus]|uniref:Uncharacterized protein n=1 Tax=Halopelagius longus TaxID=1236180 RepID=A0A1H1AW22_9EURY|nr:hypothetical protein [Halopelagius longus]SDQ43870.1 hypothetical protein SAMN05216278_1516 [Halopelagius longus]